MGTRFAGSPRVGDRRRRLMAAGTEDVAGDAAPSEQIPAPVGKTRLVDQGHADEPSIQPTIAIGQPLSRIVPLPWWQYLVAGLGCLIVGGAITAAGCHVSVLRALLGPAVGALFELPNGPVAKWFSSVLLSLAAQVALLIWWARAQSLKDFDGRYWLWIRVACGCLFVSACVATDAHSICQSIVRHFRPQIGGWRLTLGWLVPAAIVGGLTARALSREMRGCRASRLLILTTAGCYLAAALQALEIQVPWSSATRQLLMQSSLLAGHISLFVGLWYHARHVVYCTADPASTPARTWRIPRPHFKFPSLRLPRRKKSGNESIQEDHETAAKKTRRKRAATSSAAEPAAKPAAAIESPGEPAQDDLAAKTKLRIDSRHVGPSGTNERTRFESMGGSAQQLQRGSRDQVSIATHRPEPDPVELSDLERDTPAENSIAEDDASAGDESSESQSARPDLRGLSKKQRRRLMQEMRDRERAAGR